MSVFVVDSPDAVSVAGPRRLPPMARPAPSYQPRERWSAAGTWNSQRVIAALRDWMEYTGVPPRAYGWDPSSAATRGLPSAGGRLWAQQHPRWPSTATVIRYFDRWNDAMRAAGLTPRREIASGRGRADRVLATQRMARDGVPIADIAEILDISPRTARAYLRARPCIDCGTPVITAELCPKCAARRATLPRLTRARVLDAIRTWTEETGWPPTVEDWTPTQDPATKWAREYPRWPSNVTVRTHFGSWSSALGAAGVAANRRRWDRDSIIEVLRGMATELGRPPRGTELAGRDKPARGTVAAHFGSFGAALDEADLRPHRRRWSREEILAAVAGFQAQHGRVPTQSDWPTSTAEHPHASTVRQRFGSWQQMLSVYAEIRLPRNSDLGESPRQPR